MKKLLYITVNSKPEDESASRTVGRAFVNKFLKSHKDFELDELDLYKTHIPRLEYQYFEGRNTMVRGEGFEKLSDLQKEEVNHIIRLCEQFIEADVYVIAAPMWSLSFPAPLKEYIDCIVQDGKTITFEDTTFGGKPKGLLDDKRRTVVYIQSSGGSVPWILNSMFNQGLNYIEDIMKFMGIKCFEKLLVDGTGYTKEEQHKAMEEAKDKIDAVIAKVQMC